VRDAGLRGLKTIRRTNEGKDQGVNRSARREGIIVAYQRERGYKGWIRRRRYLAVVQGAVAMLSSGRTYEITKEGPWRRLKNLVEEKVV